MLKVLYQKLRLKCKGSLNYNNYSNLSKLQLKETRKLDKVGRAIIQGIPVLSIFALVGILAFSVMLPSNHLTRLFGIDKLFGLDNLLEDSNKAYAEEGITPLADTSASLTVDDGKIKDTIFAANGEFAYASHKITLEATNIKSYTLTLSKTAGLTGPSTIDGANGKTPDQMDNAWGYAFINDGADPTSATYQTLASSNTLSGPAIDGNHNLSGSKQLVFGAKFGSSAMSGTYHAEATLSLVATPRVVTNYIVNVNCNSGTNCTSTLNTSSDAESYVYTISSTTPTRSGYKFLGYNTTNTTTANTNYAPGKTVTLTTANPTLTLYAIWQQDIQTIKTITNMQQMTAAICAASATGDTNTLTDTRDSSTYTVAKLSDGNCWMTQNLRIVNKTITSADSNVNVSYKIPASAVWGIPSNEADYPKTEGAYYGGNEIYGSYYSWFTATAGTTDSSTVEAEYDICPKGWKLPTGESNSGNFAILYTLYPNSSPSGFSEFQNTYGHWLGAASAVEGGIFFPTAGMMQDNAIKNTGADGLGYYWSNKASYGGKSAYYLMLNKTYIWACYSGDLHTTWGHRYNGYSIRCVNK